METDLNAVEAYHNCNRVQEAIGCSCFGPPRPGAAPSLGIVRGPLSQDTAC